MFITGTETLLQTINLVYILTSEHWRRDMGNIFGTWKCIFFGPAVSIAEKKRNYGSVTNEAEDAFWVLFLALLLVIV